MSGRDTGGSERLFAFADRLQESAVAEQEREELESWVTFEVAAMTLALPVVRVLEVLRAGPMTRVPGAPFPVRGVISLRGSVLPVLDLGERLGLSRVEPGPEARVLIVESRRRRLGLLVDAAHQMAQIAPSTIAPAPSTLLADTTVTAGVCEIEEGRLILLDLDRLLSIDDPDEDTH